MSKTVCLYGGPLFDGQVLHSDAAIVFDRESILEIVSGRKKPAADLHVDVEGAFILPGLVDLHSDAVEKCVEMRPGVFFDTDFAILNLDRRLAACGITTFCHALSFGQEEAGLRASEAALELVDRIRHFAASEEASLRHKIHGRYEVGTPDAGKTLSHLLEAGFLDMVSVMDHTPGQGQFRTFESYRDYYTRSHGVSEEELFEVARRKNDLRDAGWETMGRMAQQIRSSGLPFMSHDDDTKEKIRLIAELGVSASEFPVSMEAAMAAREEGMKVFMGAPNLFRGKSSSGQLAAADTVAAGLCDGLISDYYPECLLQTPFAAHKKLGIPLEKAFGLVTSGPGSFLDPEGRTGQLRPDGPADLVVVKTGCLARVRETWVAGRRVYRAG